jgi:hypothetical protein
LRKIFWRKIGSYIPYGNFSGGKKVPVFLAEIFLEENRFLYSLRKISGGKEVRVFPGGACLWAFTEGKYPKVGVFLEDI